MPIPTRRRRVRKLEYGQLDYCARSKQWAVVVYGPRIETVGLFPTQAAATTALRAYVDKHHGQKGYGRPI